LLVGAGMDRLSGYELLSAIGSTLSGLAAAAALVVTWVDRIARERPFLGIDTGRVVSDRGKKLVDDVFLQNAGLGPAVELAVAGWVEPPQGLKKQWPLGDKPIVLTKAVLPHGEDIRFSFLQTFAHQFLYVYGDELPVMRGQSTESPRFSMKLGLLYRDRGKTWYYQSARLSLAAELYRIDAKDFGNISLLGENDPLLAKTNAEVEEESSRFAVSVGLVSVFKVKPSPQYQFGMWVLPWHQAWKDRRAIRKALQELEKYR
jgi:hypothetical protein